MRTRPKLMLLLAFLLFAVTASADSVYVISMNLANGNRQFGTVDLSAGAFQQIGPATPDIEYRGLVPASNGSLLTLSFAGNLTSINPATGLPTVIGPTGLSDCSTPGSPCGPNSAGVLAGLGGTLYATDFSQNLYTVNPATGAAKLIGATGIPPVPFVSHFTSNPDGSANVFEATLFAANGKLYATFDTNTLDPATGQITHELPNNLYQLDPNTGVGTLVAPTTQTLTAAAEVNGTTYAFDIETQQLLTLDLANGHTSVVTDVDPVLGYVEGAAPTPEPVSIGLAISGIAAIGVCRLRRHGQRVTPESTM
ncbi:MAG TPA: hypothetical protein VLJ11_08280 [Bryobacteraceae bacterium]|nr:hypothetical protein [Bryobacteraceae bacterium]